MKSSRYLRLLGLPLLFGTQRTKEILHVNPTVIPYREEAQEVSVFVYDYDADNLKEEESSEVDDCLYFKNSNRVSWINIDGLRKSDVEKVCNHYGVHPLLVEDILSINQRPKMDEVDGVMFCLLNMLYYNSKKNTVETEQISIVLGKDFVISFQEDASRDVFDPLRVKLQLTKSQIRQKSADYLMYAMLDVIVDNYFVVMEKVSDQIELLEEEVIRRSNTRTLARINQLRKNSLY